ncbi:MAG: 7-cyano-7-deazaguanine reductase [Acidimicrobiia bacterium]|nr:7-cyano-7-deazaguanine reductase [Acidimicrobiia bacterium]
MSDANELTLLGSGPTPAPTNPIDGASQLESIQIDPAVTEVRFSTDELLAFCPVTNQPDYYDCELTLTPTGGRSVETKTLKQYLASWRDEGIFAENLAAAIATDIARATGAAVQCDLSQHVRGGIRITATATAG